MFRNASLTAGLSLSIAKKASPDWMLRLRVLSSWFSTNRISEEDSSNRLPSAAESKDNFFKIEIYNIYK